MINPNQVIVWYARRNDRARGTKVYHAGFDLPTGSARISRAKFKTATDAVEYGERVKARWIRLYAVAVDQAAAVPTPTH